MEANVISLFKRCSGKRFYSLDNLDQAKTDKSLREPGIYAIVCTVTDQIYIGQTRCTIYSRWNQHFAAATKDNANKCKFYQAVREYGAENFICVNVCNADLESLDGLEESLIDCYDTVANGLNSKRGGGNGNRNDENCKPVVQLTIDGEFVGTYRSANTAQQELDKIASSTCHHVAEVCLHRAGRNTAYGYKWIYLDEAMSNEKYAYLVPSIEEELSKKI